MKTKRGKFRYIELADRIQDQIEKGAFKLSEKLIKGALPENRLQYDHGLPGVYRA